MEIQGGVLWIIELLVDVQIPQCKLLINVQDNKDKIDDIRDDAGIVTYYVIADIIISNFLIIQGYPCKYFIYNLALLENYK